MRVGRIPEEVIEAVLKHHDIADVVGKYVHLTKQGHYLKGLCPFHSENTPSFTVTPERQIYHCFGCGAGGGIIKFLREIEGYSFAEAVNHLAEEAGIPITWETADPVQTKQQQERTEVIKAHDHAAKVYQYILKNTEQGKQALDYLRSRGIADKLIDRFQIGYAPARMDTLVRQLERNQFSLSLMEKGGLISIKSDKNGYIDRFRDRIMFPLHDFHGKIIAFAGRALGDVKPKYMNSPESILFNKSRSIYNLHHARAEARKSGEILLLEGYMDVIKAWEAGITNAVATMGTALTPEQSEILKRNADRVIVCYDGDPAGQNAAYKSIPILEKSGCAVKVAMIPEGKDPDEYITAYGPERFVRQIVEQAVPAMKYKLLFIRKNFKLHNEFDKLRYLKTATKMIAALHSPIDREHYLKQLSSDFDTSLESLKQDVAAIRFDLEKKQSLRDNKEFLWNNVRNNGNRVQKSPSLFPAYHNAERQLLAIMMHDPEVCRYVQEQVGDEFNVEDHAVLAAYLYAYYSQYAEPNLGRYMAMLEDTNLENLASSIALIGAKHGLNDKVIDDYIREIKKYPRQQEIKQKKEEMRQAELSGDPLRAAQILSEIIALEKQLK
ncbi:DNA primase [Paenibacillus larvae]